MAFYDYIKFINFKNNTNNVLNKTLNGKTYVTNFGNSYWSFDIKTVPITRTTWHSDFFDFYDTETTAKNTTFLLPVLNDAAGTVSGTVSVLDDSSTAPEYSVSVGETKIPVSGGSGTLLAGDLIKFSNHSKVYMLSEDTNLDTIITNYNNKVKEIKSKLETVKKKINMFDVVKYIVSEEGVKSYIVKQILHVFNQKLAYYLKKMDSNCICIFNEYFEEQIINEKNKLCSYFNFSGAERKNIDLACLFAFMDIRRLQGDVTFNFSIYDELFDSSLDERGVDLVTSILRERVEKYKECVYVISHRKESVKAATGEVIYLEKSNGITRRVKYTEIDKD